MKLFLALGATLVVAGAAPGAAPATTQLQGPAHRVWMDRCLDRALVHTPQLTLTVLPNRGRPGVSWAAPWRRAIYLDRRRESREACHILLHELAHVFDWTLLQARDRQRLACSLLRERSANPWWGYRRGNRWRQAGGGRASPLERFAEAYSYAALGRQLLPGRDWPRSASLRGISFHYGVLRHLPTRGRVYQLRRFLRQVVRGRIADPQRSGQTVPLRRCRRAT